MPVIPTVIAGRAKRVEPRMLWSIMCFPRDEQKRKHYLASLQGFVVGKMEEHFRQRPEYESLPLGGFLGDYLGRSLESLGGFSVLSEAPNYEAMLDRAVQSVWPGCVAGDLLIHLIQMHAAGVQASVNKAVAIEKVFLAEAAAADGSSTGKTERYIRRAWEEFKPACHLWAAWRLLERTGSVDEQTNGRLALSHILLDLALSLRPKGRREHLLRAEDMWHLPRRYEHPVLIHFKIPPLDDWQLKALRDYKPSRS